MGLVNTYSEYSSGANFSAFRTKDEGRIDRQIAFLKKRELEFYNTIFKNCSGFQDFKQRMETVKLKLQKNPADMLAIEFFKRDNFKNWLINSVKSEDRFQGNASYNCRIKIDSAKTAQQIQTELNNQLLSLVGAGSNTIKVTSVEAGHFDFDIGLNIHALKLIGNTFFGKHYKVATKSRRTVLRDYEKAIQSRLGEVVKIDSSVKSYVEGLPVLQIRNSPFNYNKDDIDRIRAGKRNSITEEVISDRIQNQIKAAINFEACTKEFQVSFLFAWRNLVSKASIASLTWNGTINNLVGAFGELQVSLLFLYLRKMADKVGLTGEAFSKLRASFVANISDPFQSGEQAKSDLTLLEQLAGIDSFGVQVKNYGVQGDISERKISVNTHLDKFYSSLDALEGESNLVNNFQDNQSNIYSFLANYFFNTSFKGDQSKNFSNLLQGFKQCFADIASFNIGKGQSDVVNFYFIGGQYLIPASEILTAYYKAEKSIKGRVSITSSFPGKSDSEYGPQYGDSKVFLKHYKYPKGVNTGELSPTPQVEKDYNRIVSSLSIRASFFYSSLLGDGFNFF